MPPGPCTLLKQPVCIETPSPFLQHLIGLHSNALPDAGPLKGSEVTRIKLQTQAQAGGKGQAGRDRHRQTQAGTGNKRQAGTDSQISSGGSPNTPQLTDRHRHRHRTSDCVRSPTCRSPPPQSFGTPPPVPPPHYVSPRFQPPLGSLTSFPSSFTLSARSTPASSSGSFGTSSLSSIAARTSPAMCSAFSASAPGGCG